MIGRAKAGLNVSITGLGAYAPERVLSNDELARIVDTSDEWIVERTGIRERRIAGPDDSVVSMATYAAGKSSARKHVAIAGLARDEIVRRLGG